jgi:dTMP kinase
LFITFEGIDLSGKSTQAKLFFEYLKKSNKKVILLREPGGTIISEQIRNILLHKSDSKMDDMTEFLLFSSARSQLTREVIKPHLNKGYTVICDRYFDSSMAYQGYGGKVDRSIIKKLNTIASGNLLPDLTFLINITYKESLKRKNPNYKADRIEQKKSSYFNKVVNGYLDIASKNKKRVKVLDGTDSIEHIQSKIVELYNKRTN